MTLLKETYPVLGMECASCVRKIESLLEKTAGIKSASINFASEKITIEYDKDQINIKKIAELINSAGYELIT